MLGSRYILMVPLAFTCCALPPSFLRLVLQNDCQQSRTVVGIVMAIYPFGDAAHRRSAQNTHHGCRQRQARLCRVVVTCLSRHGDFFVPGFARLGHYEEFRTPASKDHCHDNGLRRFSVALPCPRSWASDSMRYGRRRRRCRVRRQQGRAGDHAIMGFDLSSRVPQWIIRLHGPLHEHHSRCRVAPVSDGASRARHRRCGETVSVFPRVVLPHWFLGRAAHAPHWSASGWHR